MNLVLSWINNVEVGGRMNPVLQPRKNQKRQLSQEKPKETVVDMDNGSRPFDCSKVVG
jgi:hypothetical protein